MAGHVSLTDFSVTNKSRPEGSARLRYLVQNLERTLFLFQLSPFEPPDLFHMNFNLGCSENTKFISDQFEVFVFIEVNDGYTKLICNVSFN
jgi:hypothetical protein